MKQHILFGLLQFFLASCDAFGEKAVLQQRFVLGSVQIRLLYLLHQETWTAGQGRCLLSNIDIDYLIKSKNHCFAFDKLVLLSQSSVQPPKKKQDRNKTRLLF